MANYSSPSVLQHRRSELEARIEEMIALLDILDGDCHLEDNGDDELSLGASGPYVKGKFECDLEQDPAEMGIADRDALDLFLCDFPIANGGRAA
ncbi:hypothetical protein FP026_08445 [Rhizobium tropici]|uniref:Uncharacterized protein n=1 Tax=Rhizobium tropici TaxID=398 RepID=A0A5B0W545_RHITR|nr:hypothetical protein [Rhizobium tropici]KAA1182106.1 hypothetical protein FP026_08445 [Rhizobium tropici]